ncbi:hypothetical protein [Zymomonas mobilis]|nr:hypothetical protein [Zymomonas mobilis]
MITGSMFSMIYPLIGFLLIKLTVKKPIPENLLSSFPIQKRDIFFGSFLASFFILTMHLIFIALIGSVKNLPITSLHQIPYVISLCFIISFPSIVMTSTVVSIEEYCGLKDAKTRSILVVALWIAWISYMGVSLHGIGWDISGIKFPILKVFHQSNINIGFVSLKNKTEFIFDFNNFFLDKSYIFYQIIRSSLWLLILWLAGSKEFVLKINALPSFNSAIFQKKACGFKPVSFVLGWIILVSRQVTRLFQGKTQFLFAILLLISQLLTSHSISDKISLVAWGLYITRWSAIGRLIEGKEFSILEFSLPLGGWKFGIASIVAIALQMIFLSLGEMVVYPSVIASKLFQILICSSAAVLLLRITGSKTPFLILAITAWYALVTG